MAQTNVDVKVAVKGEGDLNRLVKRMNVLEKEVSQLNGKLPSAANNVRKFGAASGNASKSVDGLSKKLGKLAVQMAAVAAASIGFQQSLAAAFERGNAEKRLQNLTGSTAEYEQALRLAKLASADFGISQSQATKALGDTYSRLQAVGYGLTEVNEVYRGFNVVAREAGVSADDASGAFLQLSQGLGAGVLNGENLATILERMPQLAQLLATEAGVAAGAVKQAGADGKITGDVIYAALSKAAAGAGDLSGKLTEQQATMNKVNRRAEELKVKLGQAFAPTVLAALNMFGDLALVAASYLEKLNTWATANAESIKRVVLIGLEIAKIGASVLIVAKAYALWRKAVLAVAAAKAALLALSGVGLAKVTAAVVAGAAAYGLMSKSIEDVSNEIGELQGKQKEEIDAIRKQAGLFSDQFREYKKTSDLSEKRASQERQIEQVLRGQLSSVVSRETIEQKSLNAAQSRLQNQNTLIEARFGLFSKLNELEIQRAQNAGNTQKVLSLQAKQADLIYEKTLLQIKSEVKKAEMAALQVKIEYKKLEAATKLKAAKGEAVQADFEALALQKQAVQLAIEGANTAKLAAGYNMQTANAIRQMTVEQNKFNAAQRSGASSGGSSSGGGGGNLKVEGVFGTRSIGSQTAQSLYRDLAAAGATGTFDEAQASQFLRNIQQKRVDAFEKATKGTTAYRAMPSERDLQGYADGGYVSSPTNALIGEGGESEYVIPSSKMQESVRRYSAGARGSAVVSGGNNAAAGGGGGGASYSSENNAYVGGGSNQINVTTGPVIRMNNQNYVSMGDLQRGMSEAVSAAESNMNSRMRRSFSARRGMEL